MLSYSCPPGFTGQRCERRDRIESGRSNQDESQTGIHCIILKHIKKLQWFNILGTAVGVSVGLAIALIIAGIIIITIVMVYMR